MPPDGCSPLPTCLRPITRFIREKTHKRNTGGLCSLTPIIVTLKGVHPHDANEMRTGWGRVKASAGDSGVTSAGSRSWWQSEGGGMWAKWLRYLSLQWTGLQEALLILETRFHRRHTLRGVVRKCDFSYLFISCLDDGHPAACSYCSQCGFF